MHRHAFLLFLLAAMPGIALSQVNVFSRLPDAASPVRDVDHPAVVADYVVTPNIRGLAENLVRDRPAPIIFPIPGRAALKLNVHRWDPLDGFEFDERGSVRVSPGAGDADLSFNVYGGSPGFELLLIVRKGRVTASLTGQFKRLGQAWTIVESRGRLVLRDRDTTDYPGHPDDRPIGGEKAKVDLAVREKRAVDGGGTVHVVVMHTANAIAVAGSEGAMNDLITGSIVAMQTALGNSQAYRVAINHVLVNGPLGPQPSEPVGYNESPNIASNVQRWYAHRVWARTDPTAVAIRDAYEADLVVMVVGDAGFCGVAYTQRPDCGAASGEQGLCDVGAGYEDFAVSVISTQPNCDLTTHTLAHEVGHQFGMEHDRLNGAAAANASFPWSYGFAVNGQARTIMAYEIASGPTATCPNGCPIQLHYSNANVQFTNVPGVATGTAAQDGQGRTTANARTAVVYAPEMETFRGPVVPDVGVFGHGFEPLPEFICNPAVWANCPQP